MQQNNLFTPEQDLSFVSKQAGHLFSDNPALVQELGAEGVAYNFLNQQTFCKIELAFLKPTKKERVNTHYYNFVSPQEKKLIFYFENQINSQGLCEFSHDDIFLQFVKQSQKLSAQDKNTILMHWAHIQQSTSQYLASKGQDMQQYQNLIKIFNAEYVAQTGQSYLFLNIDKQTLEPSLALPPPAFIFLEATEVFQTLPLAATQQILLTHEALRGNLFSHNAYAAKNIENILTKHFKLNDIVFDVAEKANNENRGKTKEDCSLREGITLAQILPKDAVRQTSPARLQKIAELKTHNHTKIFIESLKPIAQYRVEESEDGPYAVIIDNQYLKSQPSLFVERLFPSIGAAKRSFSYGKQSLVIIKADLALTDIVYQQNVPSSSVLATKTQAQVEKYQLEKMLQDKQQKDMALELQALRTKTHTYEQLLLSQGLIEEKDITPISKSVLGTTTENGVDKTTTKARKHKI